MRVNDPRVQKIEQQIGILTSPILPHEAKGYPHNRRHQQRGKGGYENISLVWRSLILSHSHSYTQSRRGKNGDLGLVSVEDGFEQLFHRLEFKCFEQGPHMLP